MTYNLIKKDFNNDQKKYLSRIIFFRNKNQAVRMNLTQFIEPSPSFTGETAYFIEKTRMTLLSFIQQE